MNIRNDFVGNTATSRYTVDFVSSMFGVFFLHRAIILTLQLDLSFTKEVCHCVVVALKPQYLSKDLCHRNLIANVSLFISIHLLSLSWKCGICSKSKQTNWTERQSFALRTLLSKTHGHQNYLRRMIGSIVSRRHWMLKNNYRIIIIQSLKS